MIIHEKTKNAVIALQRVIIRARTMAYEKEDHREIAGILDDAEYLAALIWEERDQTDVFRRYLEHTAHRYRCMSALQVFDDGEKFSGNGPGVTKSP